MLNKLTISIIILITAAGIVSAQSPLLPGKLAIYYGYPGLVNESAGDIDKAVEVFNDYDIVVFGDSLQFPQYTGAQGQNPDYGCKQNSHKDHDNTVKIIGKLRALRYNTSVYGYISIGGENTERRCEGNTLPAPLSMNEIKSRIDAWARMGVRGIFLDEAGYDYGCSRERQNEVVDYVHRKGIRVFINAWDPDDVFSAKQVGKVTYSTGAASTIEMNPKGTRSRLSAGDTYLLESFQIINGAYQDPVVWENRCNKASYYKRQFGAQVATVTTASSGSVEFDQGKLDYAWYSTLIYGFNAMGWGEKDFSASDNKLPFHQRPNPGEIGMEFTSPVNSAPPVYKRSTTTGTIEIDTSTHKCKFTWNLVDGIYVWTDETSNLQDINNLVSLCSDLFHPIGIIFLSNYKAGGYLNMWSAANLRNFNTLAHKAGITVYALYTNKDWISKVLDYNLQCFDQMQRFDGVAMDYEEFTGGKPSTAADIKYYADARAACGKLPLHVSIGWHWDDQISYSNVTRPAYQHIFDIASSVDVQTAFDKADAIKTRAQEELAYAANLSKPVLLTIETQNLAGKKGMTEDNTFYGEGETAMWKELAAVKSGAGVFTGFVLHYYGNSYNCGTKLWQWHTPACTNVIVKPKCFPNLTSIIFSNVTTPGFTSVSTGSTGELPPQGFKIGTPPIYFDLTTTAKFSGTIKVTIKYSDIKFVAERALRLFHFENGKWVDRTSSLDTENNIISASVTSLSSFTIFESEKPPAEQPSEETKQAFISGIGWINSPASAYVLNLSLVGKASFGFFCGYKKDSATPDGLLSFSLRLADLNFFSTEFQSLVVSGSKARFNGTGVINKEGNYSFLVSIIDGQIDGKKVADKFRIKIWNKDKVVYDNQIGAPNDADPIHAIEGGNIGIYKFENRLR